MSCNAGQSDFGLIVFHLRLSDALKTKPLSILASLDILDTVNFVRTMDRMDISDTILWILNQYHS